MNSSFSLDAEMSLEEDENKIFKGYLVLKISSIIHPREFKSIKEREFKTF